MIINIRKITDFFLANQTVGKIFEKFLGKKQQIKNNNNYDNT
jgi:hypothetical protein